MMPLADLLLPDIPLLMLDAAAASDPAASWRSLPCLASPCPSLAVRLHRPPPPSSPRRRDEERREQVSNCTP